jgi:hypothetical protein
MKKDAKLAAWVAIDGSKKPPPLFERWTNDDDAKLLEAQSDVVEMAHTAIGHLEELKKKELLLAAMTMTEEEFNSLAEKRSAAMELSSNFHPPIPEPELIAALIGNAIDEASDMSGNFDGIIGGEEGI